MPKPIVTTASELGFELQSDQVHQQVRSSAIGELEFLSWHNP